jgi:hypothetical protein
MFDITRVVVVRAVITPVDKDPKPVAKTEEESTETIPWMHQDTTCMNFQHISIHATQVECDECGVVVDLTEKKSIMNKEQSWEVWHLKLNTKKSHRRELFQVKLSKLVRR